MQTVCCLRRSDGDTCYAGTFEGDDVTHYGGLATFQATYGTAKGSHSVTGDSIRCESDSSGVFVVTPMPPQNLHLAACPLIGHQHACMSH